MATFTFHCPCAKRVAFHAEEQHIGRFLRCREQDCDRLIEIQRPPTVPQSMGSQQPSRPQASSTPAAPAQASPHPHPAAHASKRLWWQRPLVHAVLLGVVVCGGAVLHAFLAHPSSPAPISPPAAHVPTAPGTPACPSPATSLPTGTELTPLPERQGLGELMVHNGHDVDAVVRLVDAQYQRMIYRSVYIRAGDRVTLYNIAVGRYRLQFALGDAWDEAMHDFLCRTDHLQFQRILDFDELPDTQGTQYTTMQFTIHPVLGGTEHPQSITPEAWQGGHWPTGGPATTRGVQNQRY